MKALAVARYTLIELSRRRILLVFFIIGAAGLLLFGVGFRVLYSFATASNGRFVATNLPPDVFNRILELQFLSYLYGALGTFALLIAFGIGMTAIYHDLESGAAVSIFSKPVTRAEFTAGKIAAAVASLIVIVGLLAIEARLVMLLVPGAGLEGSLTGQVIATTANTLLLMLLVLALSTWMNNIVAAIVAFVYNEVVTGVIVTVHNLFASGAFDNAILKAVFDVLYWIVPHELVSSAPGDLVRAQAALSNEPSGGRVVALVPAASGFGDIVWWAFLVVLFAGLVYFAVRRRQV